MTWGNPPKFKSDPPKQGKKITPEMLAGDSEDSQQMALFAWAADNVGRYPQLAWLFAIPNGGSRHIAEATKLVAAGVRKGVPDLMLPYASKNEWYRFDGLFIEMKTAKRLNEKNGGCSDEQLAWRDWLSVKNNYCWRVCYSWRGARDVLIAYLEGKL